MYSTEILTSITLGNAFTNAAMTQENNIIREVSQVNHTPGIKVAWYHFLHYNVFVAMSHSKQA